MYHRTRFPFVLSTYALHLAIPQVALLADEQRRGYEMGGLLEAVQKLADAQSRRSAVAAQVLPGMHWVSGLP